MPHFINKIFWFHCALRAFFIFILFKTELCTFLLKKKYFILANVIFLECFHNNAESSEYQMLILFFLTDQTQMTRLYIFTENLF